MLRPYRLYGFARGHRGYQRNEVRYRINRLKWYLHHRYQAFRSSLKAETWQAAFNPEFEFYP